jgi:hypothetical protein
MPSLTHRSAIARPMPLAAPVMTATLPLNSFIALFPDGLAERQWILLSIVT